MSRLVLVGCTRELFPVGFGKGKIGKAAATDGDPNATGYGLLMAIATRPAANALRTQLSMQTFRKLRGI